MTVVNFREAAIVVLGDVEQVLADSAGQLFNRTIVAIWDNRGDVHNALIPFRSIIHVSLGKDAMTMSTLRPAQLIMAPDPNCVNREKECANFLICKNRQVSMAPVNEMVIIQHHF